MIFLFYSESNEQGQQARESNGQGQQACGLALTVHTVFLVALAFFEAVIVGVRVPE